MLTYVQNTCLYCGRSFKAITYRHKFCCRAHYMKYYRKRAINEKKYPSYICLKCREKQDLTFSPKIDPQKWNNYKCPICGYRPLET